MIEQKKISQTLIISISLTTIIPILVILYLVNPSLFTKESTAAFTLPIIIAITLFIVSIGIYILFSINRSISELSKSALSIAKGNLTQDVKLVKTAQKPVSEVTGLAESLNLITEQLILNVDEFESKAILLERSNRELERLNLKKTDFISTATHELRAPMINIKQCAAMLLENQYGVLSFDQKEKLIMIKNNAQRLIQLIADLLDVSKLDSGQMQIEAISLQKTVLDTVAMVSHWCESKGIIFQVKLPQPEIIIYADEERIRQVFTNLLSNAIKYTSPRGRIEIFSQFSEKEAPEREGGQKNKGTLKRKFVDVSVKDNGIGIDQKDLAKIFERFVKMDHPDFSQGSISTGLGLSIVKEIMEMHGGFIDVQSEKGRGSVFTVSLPLFPSDNPEIK